MRLSLRMYWYVVVLVLAVGGFNFARAQGGDWKNTIAAVVLDDRLYTVESNGALYATDLNSGRWVAVGKPDFGKTRFLFAGNKNLLSIEQDGSLYRINPASGAWVRLGEAHAWKNTLAGAFVSDRLYTVEATGHLYATNPGTGVWTQVGKPEFGKTQRMFSAADALYTIEADGSLYGISPGSGAWRQVGDGGGWKNTIARTTMGGKIYTIETSGALYETNPTTGKWIQLGKPEFGKTRFLFAANGSLYTLEDGSLYRVDPATGKWSTVGK